MLKLQIILLGIALAILNPLGIVIGRGRELLSMEKASQDGRVQPTRHYTHVDKFYARDHVGRNISSNSSAPSSTLSGYTTNLTSSKGSQTSLSVLSSTKSTGSNTIISSLLNASSSYLSVSSGPGQLTRTSSGVLSSNSFNLPASSINLSSKSQITSGQSLSNTYDQPNTTAVNAKSSGNTYQSSLSLNASSTRQGARSSSLVFVPSANRTSDFSAKSIADILSSTLNASLSSQRTSTRSSANIATAASDFNVSISTPLDSDKSLSFTSNSRTADISQSRPGSLNASRSGRLFLTIANGESSSPTAAANRTNSGLLNLPSTSNTSISSDRLRLNGSAPSVVVSSSDNSSSSTNSNGFTNGALRTDNSTSAVGTGPLSVGATSSFSRYLAPNQRNNGTLSTFKGSVSDKNMTVSTRLYGQTSLKPILPPSAYLQPPAKVNTSSGSYGSAVILSDTLSQTRNRSLSIGTLVAETEGTTLSPIVTQAGGEGISSNSLAKQSALLPNQRNSAATQAMGAPSNASSSRIITASSVNYADSGVRRGNVTASHATLSDRNTSSTSSGSPLGDNLGTGSIRSPYLSTYNASTGESNAPSQQIPERQNLSSTAYGGGLGPSLNSSSSVNASYQTLSAFGASSITAPLTVSSQNATSGNNNAGKDSIGQYLSTADNANHSSGALALGSSPTTSIKGSSDASLLVGGSKSLTSMAMNLSQSGYQRTSQSPYAELVNTSANSSVSGSSAPYLAASNSNSTAAPFISADTRANSTKSELTVASVENASSQTRLAPLITAGSPLNASQSSKISDHLLGSVSYNVSSSGNTLSQPGALSLGQTNPGRNTTALGSYIVGTAQGASIPNFDSARARGNTTVGPVMLGSADSTSTSMGRSNGAVTLTSSSNSNSSQPTEKALSVSSSALSTISPGPSSSQIPSDGGLHTNSSGARSDIELPFSGSSFIMNPNTSSQEGLSSSQNKTFVPTGKPTASLSNSSSADQGNLVTTKLPVSVNSTLDALIGKSSVSETSSSLLVRTSIETSRNYTSEYTDQATGTQGNRTDTAGMLTAQSLTPATPYVPTQDTSLNSSEPKLSSSKFPIHPDSALSSSFNLNQSSSAPLTLTSRPGGSEISPDTVQVTMATTSPVSSRFNSSSTEALPSSDTYESNKYAPSVSSYLPTASSSSVGGGLLSAYTRNSSGTVTGESALSTMGTLKTSVLIVSSGSVGSNPENFTTSTSLEGSATSIGPQVETPAATQVHSGMSLSIGAPSITPGDNGNISMQASAMSSNATRSPYVTDDGAGAPVSGGPLPIDGSVASRGIVSTIIATIQCTHESCHQTGYVQTASVIIPTASYAGEPLYTRTIPYTFSTDGASRVLTATFTLPSQNADGSAASSSLKTSQSGLIQSRTDDLGSSQPSSGPTDVSGYSTLVTTVDIPCTQSPCQETMYTTICSFIFPKPTAGECSHETTLYSDVAITSNSKLISIPATVPCTYSPLASPVSQSPLSKSNATSASTVSSRRGELSVSSELMSQSDESSGLSGTSSAAPNSSGGAATEANNSIGTSAPSESGFYTVVTIPCSHTEVCSGRSYILSTIYPSGSSQTAGGPTAAMTSAYITATGSTAEPNSNSETASYTVVTVPCSHTEICSGKSYLLSTIYPHQISPTAGVSPTSTIIPNTSTTESPAGASSGYGTPSFEVVTVPCSHTDVCSGRSYLLSTIYPEATGNSESGALTSRLLSRSDLESTASTNSEQTLNTQPVATTSVLGSVLSTTVSIPCTQSICQATLYTTVCYFTLPTATAPNECMTGSLIVSTVAVSGNTKTISAQVTVPCAEVSMESVTNPSQALPSNKGSSYGESITEVMTSHFFSQAPRSSNYAAPEQPQNSVSPQSQAASAASQAQSGGSTQVTTATVPCTHSQCQQLSFTAQVSVIVPTATSVEQCMTSTIITMPIIVSGASSAMATTVTLPCGSTVALPTPSESPESSVAPTAAQATQSPEQSESPSSPQTQNSQGASQPQEGSTQVVTATVPCTHTQCQQPSYTTQVPVVVPTATSVGQCMTSSIVTMPITVSGASSAMTTTVTLPCGSTVAMPTPSESPESSVGPTAAQATQSPEQSGSPASSQSPLTSQTREGTTQVRTNNSPGIPQSASYSPSQGNQASNGAVITTTVSIPCTRSVCQETVYTTVCYLTVPTATSPGECMTGSNIISVVSVSGNSKTITAAVTLPCSSAYSQAIPTQETVKQTSLQRSSVLSPSETNAGGSQSLNGSPSIPEQSGSAMVPQAQTSPVMSQPQAEGSTQMVTATVACTHAQCQQPSYTTQVPMVVPTATSAGQCMTSSIVTMPVTVSGASSAMTTTVTLPCGSTVALPTPSESTGTSVAPTAAQATQPPEQSESQPSPQTQISQAASQPQEGSTQMVTATVPCTHTQCQQPSYTTQVPMVVPTATSAGQCMTSTIVTMPITVSGASSAMTTTVTLPCGSTVALPTPSESIGSSVAPTAAQATQSPEQSESPSSSQAQTSPVTSQPQEGSTQMRTDNSPGAPQSASNSPSQGNQVSNGAVITTTVSIPCTRSVCQETVYTTVCYLTVPTATSPGECMTGSNIISVVSVSGNSKTITAAVTLPCSSAYSQAIPTQETVQPTSLQRSSVLSPSETNAGGSQSLNGSPSIPEQSGSAMVPQAQTSPVMSQLQTEGSTQMVTATVPCTHTQCQQPSYTTQVPMVVPTATSAGQCMTSSIVTMPITVSGASSAMTTTVTLPCGSTVALPTPSELPENSVVPATAQATQSPEQSGSPASSQAQISQAASQPQEGSTQMVTATVPCTHTQCQQPSYTTQVPMVVPTATSAGQCMTSSIVTMPITVSGASGVMTTTVTLPCGSTVALPTPSESPEISVAPTAAQATQYPEQSGSPASSQAQISQAASQPQEGSTQMVTATIPCTHTQCQQPSYTTQVPMVVPTATSAGQCMTSSIVTMPITVSGASSAMTTTVTLPCGSTVAMPTPSESPESSVAPQTTQSPEQSESLAPSQAQTSPVASQPQEGSTQMVTATVPCTHTQCQQPSYTTQVPMVVPTATSAGQCMTSSIVTMPITVSGASSAMTTTVTLPCGSTVVLPTPSESPESSAVPTAAQATQSPEQSGSPESSQAQISQAASQPQEGSTQMVTATVPCTHTQCQQPSYTTQVSMVVPTATSVGQCMTSSIVTMPITVSGASSAMTTTVTLPCGSTVALPTPSESTGSSVASMTAQATQSSEQPESPASSQAQASPVTSQPQAEGSTQMVTATVPCTHTECQQPSYTTQVPMVVPTTTSAGQCMTSSIVIMPITVSGASSAMTTTVTLPCGSTVALPTPSESPESSVAPTASQATQSAEQPGSPASSQAQISQAASQPQEGSTQMVTATVPCTHTQCQQPSYTTQVPMVVPTATSVGQCMTSSVVTMPITVSGASSAMTTTVTLPCGSTVALPTPSESPESSVAPTASQATQSSEQSESLASSQAQISQAVSQPQEGSTQMVTATVPCTHTQCQEPSYTTQVPVVVPTATSVGQCMTSSIVTMPITVSGASSAMTTTVTLPCGSTVGLPTPSKSTGSSVASTAAQATQTPEQSESPASSQAQTSPVTSQPQAEGSTQMVTATVPCTHTECQQPSYTTQVPMVVPTTTSAGQCMTSSIVTMPITVSGASSATTTTVTLPCGSTVALPTPSESPESSVAPTASEATQSSEQSESPASSQAQTSPVTSQPQEGSTQMVTATVPCTHTQCQEPSYTTQVPVVVPTATSVGQCMTSSIVTMPITVSGASSAMTTTVTLPCGSTVALPTPSESTGSSVASTAAQATQSPEQSESSASSQAQTSPVASQPQEGSTQMRTNNSPGAPPSASYSPSQGNQASNGAVITTTVSIPCTRSVCQETVYTTVCYLTVPTATSPGECMTGSNIISVVSVSGNSKTITAAVTLPCSSAYSQAIPTQETVQPTSLQRSSVLSPSETNAGGSQSLNEGPTAPEQSRSTTAPQAQISPVVSQPQAEGSTKMVTATVACTHTQCQQPSYTTQLPMIVPTATSLGQCMTSSIVTMPITVSGASSAMTTTVTLPCGSTVAMPRPSESPESSVAPQTTQSPEQSESPASSQTQTSAVTSQPQAEGGTQMVAATVPCTHTECQQPSYTTQVPMVVPTTTSAGQCMTSSIVTMPITVSGASSAMTTTVTLPCGSTVALPTPSESPESSVAPTASQATQSPEQSESPAPSQAQTSPVASQPQEESTQMVTATVPCTHTQCQEPSYTTQVPIVVPTATSLGQCMTSSIVTMPITVSGASSAMTTTVTLPCGSTVAMPTPSESSESSVAPQTTQSPEQSESLAPSQAQTSPVASQPQEGSTQMVTATVPCTHTQCQQPSYTTQVPMVVPTATSAGQCMTSSIVSMPITVSGASSAMTTTVTLPCGSTVALPTPSESPGSSVASTTSQATQSAEQSGSPASSQAQISQAASQPQEGSTQMVTATVPCTHTQCQEPSYTTQIPMVVPTAISVGQCMTSSIVTMPITVSGASSAMTTTVTLPCGSTVALPTPSESPKSSVAPTAAQATQSPEQSESPASESPVTSQPQAEGSTQMVTATVPCTHTQCQEPSYTTQVPMVVPTATNAGQCMTSTIVTMPVTVSGASSAMATTVTLPCGSTVALPTPSESTGSSVALTAAQATQSSEKSESPASSQAQASPVTSQQQEGSTQVVTATVPCTHTQCQQPSYTTQVPMVVPTATSAGQCMTSSIVTMPITVSGASSAMTTTVTLPCGSTVALPTPSESPESSVASTAAQSTQSPEQSESPASESPVTSQPQAEGSTQMVTATVPCTHTQCQEPSYTTQVPMVVPTATSVEQCMTSTIITMPIIVSGASSAMATTVTLPCGSTVALPTPSESPESSVAPTAAQATQSPEQSESPSSPQTQNSQGASQPQEGSTQVVTATVPCTHTQCQQPSYTTQVPIVVPTATSLGQCMTSRIVTMPITVSGASSAMTTTVTLPCGSTVAMPTPSESPESSVAPQTTQSPEQSESPASSQAQTSPVTSQPQEGSTQMVTATVPCTHTQCQQPSYTTQVPMVVPTATSAGQCMTSSIVTMPITVSGASSAMTTTVTLPCGSTVALPTPSESPESSVASTTSQATQSAEQSGSPASSQAQISQAASQPQEGSTQMVTATVPCTHTQCQEPSYTTQVPMVVPTATSVGQCMTSSVVTMPITVSGASSAMTTTVTLPCGSTVALPTPSESPESSVAPTASQATQSSEQSESPASSQAQTSPVTSQPQAEGSTQMVTATVPCTHTECQQPSYTTQVPMVVPTTTSAGQCMTSSIVTMPITVSGASSAMTTTVTLPCGSTIALPTPLEYSGTSTVRQTDQAESKMVSTQLQTTAMPEVSTSSGTSPQSLGSGSPQVSANSPCTMSECQSQTSPTTMSFAEQSAQTGSTLSGAAPTSASSIGASSTPSGGSTLLNTVRVPCTASICEQTEYTTVCPLTVPTATNGEKCFTTSVLTQTVEISGNSVVINPVVTLPCGSTVMPSSVSSSQSLLPGGGSSPISSPASSPAPSTALPSGTNTAGSTASTTSPISPLSSQENTGSTVAGSPSSSPGPQTSQSSSPTNAAAQAPLQTVAQGALPSGEVITLSTLTPTTSCPTSLRTYMILHGTSTFLEGPSEGSSGSSAQAGPVESSQPFAEEATGNSQYFATSSASPSLSQAQGQQQTNPAPPLGPNLATGGAASSNMSIVNSAQRRDVPASLKALMAVALILLA